MRLITSPRHLTDTPIAQRASICALPRAGDRLARAKWNHRALLWMVGYFFDHGMNSLFAHANNCSLVAPGTTRTIRAAARAAANTRSEMLTQSPIGAAPTSGTRNR